MNKRRQNKIQLILSLYKYDNNIINYIIVLWTFIILYTSINNLFIINLI